MSDPSDDFMEKCDAVDRLCRELLEIEHKHFPSRTDFLFGGGIHPDNITEDTVYYAQVNLTYRQMYPMCWQSVFGESMGDHREKYRCYEREPAGSRGFA